MGSHLGDSRRDQITFQIGTSLLFLSWLSYWLPQDSRTTSSNVWLPWLPHNSRPFLHGPCAMSTTCSTWHSPWPRERWVSPNPPYLYPPVPPSPFCFSGTCAAYGRPCSSYFPPDMPRIFALQHISSLLISSSSLLFALSPLTPSASPHSTPAFLSTGNIPASTSHQSCPPSWHGLGPAEPAAAWK